MPLTTRTQRNTLGVARSLAGHVGAGAKLVSGMRPLADGTFELVALWPGRGAVESVIDADILLVVETLRQAAIVLGRGRLGAAENVVFLLSRSTVEIHGVRSAKRCGQKVRVSAGVDRVQEIDGAVVGLRLALTLHIGGTRFATAEAQVRVLSRAAYACLRDGATCSAEVVESGEAQLAPELQLSRSLADRHRPGNTWRLDLRISKSSHFSRPNDHLPDSVLLAAVGEASRQLTGWHDASLAAMDITFPDFLEVDRPTFVTLCPMGADEGLARFTLFFEQDDAPAVVGEVTLVRPSN